MVKLTLHLDSPRIFKSVGLTGSNTSLYATGIYGIVRLICVIIAMHFVVDRFGRKNMLMGGAVIMLIAMVSATSHSRYHDSISDFISHQWYIGAYIKIAKPSEGSSISSGGYSAVAFIYVFAVGFCFSYAGT